MTISVEEGPSFNFAQRMTKRTLLVITWMMIWNHRMMALSSLGLLSMSKGGKEVNHERWRIPFQDFVASRSGPCLIEKRKYIATHYF